MRRTRQQRRPPRLDSQVSYDDELDEDPDLERLLIEEREAAFLERDLIGEAADRAGLHVWEPVQPAECTSCRGESRQYFSHVFALANALLSDADDAPGTRGNPVDGYNLEGAIHAAVQVMHQRPTPYFDAAGNAGSDLDLGLTHEALQFLAGVMRPDDPRSGWNWWHGMHRGSAHAHNILADAFNELPQSPIRSRSGQVFLLGAGFSYAVSKALPTMSGVLDRLKRVVRRERWPTAKHFGLYETKNVEAWLDSLVVAAPYRSETENAEALALFLRAAQWLANDLAAAEQQAFQTRFPQPLVDLLTHWQADCCTVITMNYDTIVEHCAVRHRQEIGIEAAENTVANAIRAVPLTPTSTYRGGAQAMSDSPIPAFRLPKLHGSIDWQFPGGTGRGLPIYAVDTLPVFDSKDALPQFVPYIIPPVFTKMAMFDHEIIQQNWQVAQQGLMRAEELVVMGYSLPPADTTVVHMLASHAPPQVTLLDPDPSLRQRYEDLSGAEVDWWHHNDPISAWTSNLPATTP